LPEEHADTANIEDDHAVNFLSFRIDLDGHASLSTIQWHLPHFLNRFTQSRKLNCNHNPSRICHRNVPPQLNDVTHNPSRITAASPEARRTQQAPDIQDRMKGIS
jgi:hypothetical protein